MGSARLEIRESRAVVILSLYREQELVRDVSEPAADVQLDVQHPDHQQQPGRVEQQQSAAAQQLRLRQQLYLRQHLQHLQQQQQQQRWLSQQQQQQHLQQSAQVSKHFWGGEVVGWRGPEQARLLRDRGRGGRRRGRGRHRAGDRDRVRAGGARVRQELDAELPLTQSKVVKIFLIILYLLSTTCTIQSSLLASMQYSILLISNISYINI